ncbi:hypothetical protein [Thermodesulfatator atlanticus]
MKKIIIHKREIAGIVISCLVLLLSTYLAINNIYKNFNTTQYHSTLIEEEKHLTKELKSLKKIKEMNIKRPKEIDFKINITTQDLNEQLSYLYNEKTFTFVKSFELKKNKKINIKGRKIVF